MASPVLQWELQFKPSRRLERGKNRHVPLYMFGYGVLVVVDPVVESTLATPAALQVRLAVGVRIRMPCFWHQNCPQPYQSQLVLADLGGRALPVQVVPDRLVRLAAILPLVVYSRRLVAAVASTMVVLCLHLVVAVADRKALGHQEVLAMPVVEARITTVPVLLAMSWLARVAAVFRASPVRRPSMVAVAAAA